MDPDIENFIDLILAVLAVCNSLNFDLISLSDPLSENDVGSIKHSPIPHNRPRV